MLIQSSLLLLAVVQVIIPGSRSSPQARLTEERRCPSGMFTIPSSDQCFNLTRNRETWPQGESTCASEGLVIARPADDIAVSLRKYLFDNFGDQYIWVGGRGNGSNIAWVKDGEAVNGDLLHHLAKVDVSADICLNMHAFQNGVIQYPTRPYTTYWCTDERRVLCEEIFKSSEAVTTSPAPPESATPAESISSPEPLAFSDVGMREDISTLKDTTKDFQECPESWKNIGDNCYWFSSDSGEAATWSQAKSKCETFGGTMKMNIHLAELGAPHNLGSDYGLMETLNSIETGGWPWLGARKTNKNGDWIWEYSRRALPLNFPLWGPTQPDSDVLCLNVYYGYGGTYKRYYLNDQPCSTRQYYICQIFN